MRNIDSSQWLRNPELEVIETKVGQTLGANFTLFANQVSTLAEEDTAAAEPAAQQGGRKNARDARKPRTAKAPGGKSGGES
jgi:hypothetical protein